MAGRVLTRSGESRWRPPRSGGRSSTAATAGRSPTASTPSCSIRRAVRERVPLIDPDRILGGLFIPTDGIGKGVRAAEALAGRATEAGVAGLRRLPRDRYRRRRGTRADGRDDAGRDSRRARRRLRRLLGRQRRRARRRPPCARPGGPPVRAHRPAPRARRRAARGRPPDPPPSGSLDVLPPGPRRLRDRFLRPRAAVDRARGDRGIRSGPASI